MKNEHPGGRGEREHSKEQSTCNKCLPCVISGPEDRDRDKGQLTVRNKLKEDEQTWG